MRNAHFTQASLHNAQMPPYALVGASTHVSARVLSCTAGSDRMAPTQPKHRHADRQSADGETEVG